MNALVKGCNIWATKVFVSGHFAASNPTWNDLRPVAFCSTFCHDIVHKKIVKCGNRLLLLSRSITSRASTQKSMKENFLGVKKQGNVERVRLSACLIDRSTHRFRRARKWFNTVVEAIRVCVRTHKDIASHWVVIQHTTVSEHHEIHMRLEHKSWQNAKSKTELH